MELTKYSHACALITKGNDKLLIDPGAFTELPGDLQYINTLIITHSHQDHLDKQQVARIVEANPDIQIFGTAEVAAEITTPHVTVPDTNQDYTAGAFSLRFYGGQHAVIYKDVPVIGNFGVGVDGQVYYPGDSFTPGPEGVKVLLAPIGAPWLKMSETIDFILSQKGRLVIPTHDAVLSDAGKSIADSYLPGFCETAGGKYQRLQPGETIAV